MAATYNITIDKYADFLRTFEIKEDDLVLDITGFTFDASLKENFQASTDVDFTCTITDTTNGLFTMALTDAQTGALDPGNWVYDLRMTDTTGKITRLFQGRAFVKQGVTGS